MNENTWLVVAGGAGVFLMTWAGVAARSAWLERQEDIARRQRQKERAEQKERENLQRAVQSIEKLMAGEQ